MGIPLTECVHIDGFAVGIGSIALVDFRMLNLGLRHETAARILRYTEPWTLIALAFVVFSGAAMFMSQNYVYLVNLVFPLKMLALLAELIYNFTVHRKVATMENPPPALSKLVAIMSLLLWVSVVFAGIFTTALEWRLSDVDIAHSIESIDFLTAFSESVLAYPIVMSTHLTCIALFGGMILMTNLRLLGVTFKSLTITEMVTSLRQWKRVGRRHDRHGPPPSHL
jgi:hypothetical protein